jgi:CMP-N,N'-diacetyllegionaminic acid synthase
MVTGKTILALITARGGSKGIPQKNIIDLGGKPLLAWTIEAAQKSNYIDRLILSSDDERIIDTAKAYGCEVPFIRPAELALDTTSSMDVILHALDSLSTSYDYLLLLQPTSPFRTAAHIDQAIEYLFQMQAVSVVSISKSKKSPDLIFYKAENGTLQPIIKNDAAVTRRQDAKPTFHYNGAVYFTSIAYLKNVKNYKTPETVGLELPNFIDIDIDEPDDLAYARYLVEKKLTS